MSYLLIFTKHVGMHQFHINCKKRHNRNYFNGYAMDTTVRYTI